MRFRRPAVTFFIALSLAGAPLAADPPPAGADPAILAERLPEAALKRLRRNPAAYIAAAADAISAYGVKGAIDAAGIERMIAIERAKQRAAEVERFLRADLDGDGAVARAELGTLAARASEGRKAAMEKSFAKADADTSGAVDAAELSAHAAATALGKLSEAEAEGWLALLGFDADSDARVDAGEVIAAVATLARQAPEATAEGF